MSFSSFLADSIISRKKTEWATKQGCSRTSDLKIVMRDLPRGHENGSIAAGGRDEQVLPLED
jgi:hypothetical protein